MKNICLSSDTVKHIGRVVRDDTELWLTQSGSGCKFRFRGRKLDIILGCDDDSFKENIPQNKPRIAVRVNGRYRIKKKVSYDCERYPIISSDSVTEADVEIIKLSEAAFSLAYAKVETDDDAVISPTSTLPKRIGFIGDSITCGYGVDDSNTESDFSTETQNAMKSYAWKTAEMLGTECTLFSYSGYGIISGWTADGVRNTREVLPPHYEKVCHSYKTANGRDFDEEKWNHSLLPCDIIVVNLGTNDNSFCTVNDGAFDEFEAAYYDFLQTVHRCHPEAFIIASIGIIPISAELMERISRAAEKFRDNISPRISAFRFTSQNGDLGFGSNWHPSEDTHEYAAEEFAAYIRSLGII